MSSVGQLSSLGVGSNFELQDMLDQFKSIDQQPIDKKKDNLEAAELQLNAYDDLKAKLFDMKSHALSLSLNSNFLERELSVADEDIATATVFSGTSESANTLTVDSLASKSSWQSNGVASGNASAYTPTSAITGKGFDADEEIIQADGTLSITHGSGDAAVTVDVSLTEGMTIQEIKDAVDLADTGDKFTTAVSVGEDGKSYLNIISNGGADAVEIASSPTELAFEAPDAVVTIAQGNRLVPTNRVTSVDSGTFDADETAVHSDGTLSISHGSGNSAVTVDVALTAGMTLQEIKDAVDLADTDGNLTTALTTDDDGKVSLSVASSDKTTEIEIKDTHSELPFTTNTTSVLAPPPPMTIDVAAGTTFTQLASIINDHPDNPGVTASIIDDGSGTDSYRMVLVANDTGEDGRISIDGPIAMTEVGGAGGTETNSLNAHLTVNGIDYQRQKNSGIDDVLQGTTLTLGSTGTTSVDITADNSFLEDDIVGLVETFNEIIKRLELEDPEEDESKDAANTPITSSSIDGLKSELKSLMTTVVGSGAVRSMFDLGMDVERDGTITIDKEKLTAKIAEDPEGIKDFFLGGVPGNDGFGDLVNDALLDMASTRGRIAVEKDTTNSKIERLKSDIESSTTRLEKKYDIMAKQFVELDKFIGTMNNQASYLTEVFSSMSSSSKSSSK